MTFNEIHYHPADDGDPEWVELHNQMALRVDISGWSLSTGVAFTLPDPTVVEPGGFVLISSEPDHPSHAGHGAVFGPFAGKLDNAGETLRLRGRHGRIMDELRFGDDGKWPAAPDGGGATLAKRRPDLASGRAASWTWSAGRGGSPGTHNFAPDEPGQHELVGPSSSWQFLPRGDSPNAEWRLPEFNSDAWQAGSGPFATALVGNPGFEAETFATSPGYISGNSAISSWSAAENGAAGGESRVGINTPGVLDPFANNGAVPEGTNVAFIRGGPRSLRQPIDGLNPGTRYLLSYRENGRSPTRPIGSATLGGMVVVPQHPVAAVDSLDLFNAPYHHQVGEVFTASGSTHQLSLHNHAGIGDTVLYDATRIDPVIVYHAGSGVTPVNLAYTAEGDFVLLTARVDPGSTGQGVSLGFKQGVGSQDLGTHGVLWLRFDEQGEVVLYADESGGNHVVALRTGAPAVAGTNHVALVWERSASRASVVLNHETIFNAIDLDATAGGIDGRFNPGVTAVRASFQSAGGSLEELAVAHGTQPATTLPPSPPGDLHRLRGEFDLTGSPLDAELLLTLDTGSAARIFLNGIEIHQHPSAAATTALRPTANLRSGTNVLAVELDANAAVGGTSLNATLGLIDSSPDEIRRAPLRLSEIDAAGSTDFFVEIHNPGTVPLDLAGYSINGAALPQEMIGAGRYRAFSARSLGVSPTDELVLALTTGDGRIADAEKVENRARAFDPATQTWQHPSVSTPGAANAFALESRIVINEIHYHARPTYADPREGVAFGESDREWVELYNRSSETVDLSGWSLTDAARYDFPPDTTLEGGAFLVVDDSQFSGSLDNRGDRVELRDAHGNTADRVGYLDDAPWPALADGRGSSLELVHPDADNAHPASWAPSDESARAPWQSFVYRGRASEPPGNNNPAYFHEFLLGMLAAGEALIDDVSVIEDPDGTARELIQNGDFEADVVGATPAKWRILGTLRDSHVVALPEAGKALQLVASGPLDHSYNIASTTFADGRQIDPSRDYEIRFRARWLAGSPQLNTRLYFNRLARTHILPQPAQSGTPGGPNSRLRGGAPPTVSGLRHAPLVPEAERPVRVQAKIAAPDGIASAVVHFNDGADWQQVPMAGGTDDSYVAVLPGFPDGAVIQFYVEAESVAGEAVTAPPGGASSRALFRVGDRSVGDRQVHRMRIVMDPEDAAFMHTAHHTPSNARIGATVIYDDRECWYGVGVRLRGSPYGRRGGRVGWNLKFPTDRLFRGVHETVAIDGGYSIPRGDGGGWISVGAGVATNELIYNQMANRAGGVPASYDDVVSIEAPQANQDKLAQLKMARFGDIWKASSFEGGDEGSSFKFELIYHPRTTIDGDPEGLKAPYDRVLGADIRDMGADKEAYRHNFWIQNHTDRDDYAPVIAAGQALSSPSGQLRDATDAALDVDNWLRVMAFQSLTMTVDSYNNGLAHNMLLYGNPRTGKTVWIPWDVDHAFYSAPTTSIYGLANGDFADVVRIPANRRAYCGHLLDLCNTGFNPDYIAGWVQHYNEVGEQPIAAHFTQWITDRRNYVLGQLSSQHPAQTFRITTNGGADFSTASPQATLRGKGWIDVATIEYGGAPLAAHWIDNNDWELTVPLLAGENRIELAAFDASGSMVGSDAITITNSGAIVPATAANLVVSELMYRPAASTETEIAAGFSAPSSFEFVELLNIGGATLDLGAVSFTNGIRFDFASSDTAQLPPGGRVLIVGNRAAFEARHGGGLQVAGEFADESALANEGERIRIVGAGGVVIRDFAFDDRFPWPESSDGDGYSLVLIGPASNPDHNRASSWRSSTLPGGNPGTSDATAFSGDPDVDSDGDGLSDLMNYALGVSASEFALRLAGEPGELRLSHRRNLAADDIAFSLERSPDMVTWSPLAGAPAAEVAQGDGTSILSWSVPPTADREFVRLKAEQR